MAIDPNTVLTVIKTLGQLNDIQSAQGNGQKKTNATNAHQINPYARKNTHNVMGIFNSGKNSTQSVNNTSNNQNTNGVYSNSSATLTSLSPLGQGCQALSTIFDKLGIQDGDDLKAGLDLFKEDPAAASRTMAETLGGCPEIAEKIGGFIGKIIA